MQNESEVRAVIARLREWGDLPLHVTHLQSVEAIFDQEHRHKRGAKPVDYLRSWLSMLRPFAFATKDDSWGEMEKLLCIVLRNYIEVRRDADEAAARLEALLAERQAIADAERGTCEMPEVAAGWKPHAAGPCPVSLDSKPGVMFAGGEIVEPGERLAQFWIGLWDWWRHTTAHPANNTIAYLPEEPTANPASTAHS